MAGMKTFQYQLAFNVDKKGIEEAKTLLRQVQVAAQSDPFSKDLKEAEQAAKALSNILDSSWDNKLGQLNLDRFNKSITNAGYNINSLQKSLLKAPVSGQKAFEKLSLEILHTNTQLKNSSKFLDDMATSFSNTFKWGISSSFFNNLLGSFEKAYSYSKNLDSSLNDIRIVTKDSAKEMEKFAIQANKVSKELGSSTLDYTNAALIYYQQGLSDEEVEARAAVTLKAANVTGQSGEVVSEQLTAVWNGYKVSAEEAELYIDKLAAVAAETAADLEELSTGMSKVASAANLMGVDIDQLNAQLATIVSVTRQAPESVGTALKTIYARMGDIEAGLDGEISLDEYTKKMAAMGVNVLDANGKLRDMGDVIEEIGNSWNLMSREQQIALSQIMAGTRQYNNLLSLFDNWDMYTKAMETSANAAGELQKQQDIYMESVEAHLTQMNTEFERTYNTIFDEDAVIGLADAITLVTSTFNNFLDSLGGGLQVLQYFGVTAANIFSKQIGKGIEEYVIENIEGLNANRAKAKLQEKILQSYGYGNVRGNKNIENLKAQDSALAAELKYAEQIFQLKGFITDEETEQLSLLQQRLGKVTNELEALKNYENIITELNNDNQTDLTKDNSLEEWQRLEKEQAKRVAKAQKGYAIFKNKGDYATDSNKLGELEDIDPEAYQKIVDAIRLIDPEEENFTKLEQSYLLKSSTLDEEIDKLNQKLEIKGKLSAKEQKELENLQQSAILVKEQYNEDVERHNLRKKTALTEEELLEIQETTLKGRDEERKKLEKIKKVIEGIKQDTKTNEEDLSNEKDLIDAQLQEEIAQENRQKRISQTVQGITLVAQGIQNITSLLNILNNEELSFGEKVGALIPLALTSLSTLIPALKLLRDLNASLVASYAASTAAINANISAKINSTLATAQALKTTGVFKITKDAEIASTVLNTKAVLTESQTRAISNGVLVKHNVLGGTDIAVKGAQTKATIALTAAQKALNVVFLENPMFWVIAGLGALIAVTASAINKTKEFKAMQREANNEIIESANATQEEVDKTLELQQKYLSLYQQYETGKATKEQLAQVTDELLELLGHESVAVTKLTQDYEALNKEILEAKVAAAEEGKASAVQEKNAAGKNLTSHYNHTGIMDYVNVAANGYAGATSYVDSYGLYHAGTAFGDGGKWSDEEKTASILRENFNDTELDIDSENGFVTFHSYAKDENQAAYEQYLMLQEAKALLDEQLTATEAKDSEIYNRIVKRINALKEDAELYKKAQEDIAKYDTIIEGANIDFSTTDLQTFGENREKFINTLSKMEGYTDLEREDLEKIADSYIKTTSATASEMLDKLSITNRLTEILDEKTGDDNKGAVTAAIEQLTEEQKALLLNENNRDFVLDNYRKLQEEGNLSGTDALVLIAQALEKTREQTLLLTEAQKNQLKELGMSEEEFEEYVEQLQDVHEHLKDDTELAKKVALGNVRMNKGLKDLTSNYDDLSKVLKEDKRETAAFGKALNQMQDIVGNLLNMDGDALSADFYTSAENLKLMEQAAEGNVEAIEKLRQNAGNDIIAQIKAEATEEGLKEEIQKLDDLVDGYDTSDLKYGAKIDDEAFINDLNSMIEAAKMTKEQTEQYLKAMKYDPEFEMETKTVTVSQTHHGIYTGFDEYGKPTPIPYSWTTTEDVEVPVIKSLNYMGDANDTYSSASAGAGGGSKSKPSKIDKTENNKDRYHDVNIELKQLSNEMETLEDQKDKLFGGDLINNTAKQIANLNKQIETTNKKIGIAKNEAAELRKKLTNQGVKFNEDGTMSNYLTLYDKKLKELNAVESKYEKMSEKQREKYEETYNKAKEKFEKFVEDMSRYDELITDFIPGLETDNQDSINKQIELQIESFNYEIELRLDLKDAELEWNEFKKKIIDGIEDDDILGNAKARLVDISSYYREDGTGIIQENAEHIQELLAELEEMDKKGSDVYGKGSTQDRVTALEDLQKYYQELMKNLEEVQEIQEEMKQSQLDMMDKAEEKFGEQIEMYEHLSGLIDHDMNLITLTYGETAYDKLAEYYKQQSENNKSQLDFQRQRVEIWRQQMEAEEEGSEAWEKAKENWLAAINDANASLEASIENLKDKYLNAINLIFDKLNDKVTDGAGLDYIAEEWDLINQNADQYLDTVNSLFEMQSLENKYLDAIDDTDNVKAQQKLQKMMEEELKMLEEKDKLTQYDIDRANQKYEIALKQIALEEAQQNKNSMRLRRDTQGNYTYQFVADDEQVSQLQDELGDLYNSLYNLDVEQYKSNLDQLQSVYVEFQEKMKEAAQINDPEERAARELLIREQYEELINGIVNENEVVRNNLYESTFNDLAYLYDKNVEDFTNMTQAEQDALMNGLIPYWNSGIQSMADVFAGEGGFLPTCKDAFDELNQATQAYEDELQEYYIIAGKSIDEISSGYDKTSEQIQQLIKDNGELIETYDTELEAIKNVVLELDNLIRKYGEAEEAAKKAAKEAYDYWAKAYKQGAQEAEDGELGQEPQQQNEEPQKDTGSNQPKQETKPSLTKGSYVNVKSGVKWYSNSYGGGKSGTARSGKITFINTNGSHPYNIEGLGWIRKSDIVGYDTGGYTGNWNSREGRLAMLHEKELILNKQDTQNMLNAMQVLRNITANLGTTIMEKMASITAGNMNAIANNFNNGLEQQVHIDAQFPNVTNSTEIEDALNNLVNRASQYITK